VTEGLGFVLGTGRCGSTLVHEVLCRHPDVGFISNIEDNAPRLDRVAPFNSVIYRRLPPAFSEKGRIRYAPSEAYQALSREVSPLLAHTTRDLTADDVTPWLARRTHGFFTRRAEIQGKPTFLHKFTGWPRVGFLHAIFPEAPFVTIVRDGRAVANSWLQMPWWRGHLGPSGWHFGELPDDAREEWERAGRSNVVLAGLAWKLLVRAFEASRDAVPAALWHEYRYEDVVREPRQTIGVLLEALGLSWTPDFEAGFARYRFVSGRTDAYLDDLEPDQVKALESVMEDDLTRYGYLP
jgi:hypothetical protein